METAARILVVEDDADIACGTVRVLGQAGYVTALARGGEEALQTLPTFCPHLVLLDRQMPGMDGMEVCRRIKADPMLRGVSVVIISAVFTLAEEQVVGLESGADGYIARPIGNRELLVRVAAFVRIARLNRDLANENAERRLLEMELENRVRLRTAELDGANQDLRNEIVERQRVEELLRASESKHRKMIANIGDVIVISDASGVNRFESPNLEKWFGWRPEEVVGKSTLANIHPEDVDLVQAFLGQLLGEPRESGTTECRYRCKDGNYKWIEFTGVNLVDDPEIQGVLGNYHDITAHKLAEEEKARLEAQLQHAQKMEAVGHLAGGVAHDFNNMIQAILSNVDMALDDAPPGSPVCASLEEILKAAHRSADLVRQLLAFARQQTIAPQVLDLNETVEGLLKLLRRLIGENIHLVWVPGDQLGPVKMDPTQVDQILANLCVNARDAIFGVGKVTIETAKVVFDDAFCEDHPQFPPGEYVRLTVNDTGSGMDKTTQEHIFEPFFTTKGVGEGTGLGLSTVYGIVKQNNGYIQVYSELGHGTAFSIYLPCFAGEATPARVEAAGIRPSSSGETVLLVEDEPSLLEISRKLLDRLGYTVLSASTPGQAIQLTETHEGMIHLLMTDVVMPEMNGKDLAGQLVARHPGLRCLFMSGYTSDVIGRHCVLDEGVHFIQKPFSQQELAAKVRAVLEPAQA
jgi:PAS domain S-box-containing protein